MDVYSRKEILDVVTMLVEEISTRLRQGNFNAKGISIGIKTATFNHLHHSKILPFETNTNTDLVNEAMLLLDTFWKYNEPVRAVRVCAYKLCDASIVQLNMFYNLFEKLSLNTALDEIREKYGYYSITPAIKINNTKLDLTRVEL